MGKDSAARIELIINTLHQFPKFFFAIFQFCTQVKLPVLDGNRANDAQHL